MKISKFNRRLKTLLYTSGLLALVTLNVMAQADSRSGKSTIKVRAIYDDNERPVRRAEVNMHSEGHLREQLRKIPRLNLRPGEQDLTDIVVPAP